MNVTSVLWKKPMSESAAPKPAFWVKIEAIYVNATSYVAPGNSELPGNTSEVKVFVPEFDQEAPGSPETFVMLKRIVGVLAPAGSVKPFQVKSNGSAEFIPCSWPNSLPLKNGTCDGNRSVAGVVRDADFAPKVPPLIEY